MAAKLATKEALIEDESIPSQRKPQYGAQVTILSESERQLAKLQRKEIKKQQKFANEDVQDMSSSDLLGLNGDYLRARREEELLNNMSAPLISDPVSYLVIQAAERITKN